MTIKDIFTKERNDKIMNVYIVMIIYGGKDRNGRPVSGAFPYAVYRDHKRAYDKAQSLNDTDMELPFMDELVDVSIKTDIIMTKYYSSDRNVKKRKANKVG